MGDIWKAAREGDVAEVERILELNPRLLNAKSGIGMTPLVWASVEGQVGVVRCLLDKGAAINDRSSGATALWYACDSNHARVVRLLLDRGADATMTRDASGTPLVAASSSGHREVVRVLLGHPSGKATVNARGFDGTTALWWACKYGRWGVVRALLEGGADSTIADRDGITPMGIAKQAHHHRATVEGRRECVAALEVRLRFPLPSYQLKL
jgi:ankyrin repeat protein